MKKLVFNISKIIICLSIAPLWFVKIYRDVGHFPSQNDPNEIVQVDFYFSMFDNVTAMDWGVMIYISLGLIFISVCSSVVAAIIPQNKKLNLISNVLFALSLSTFFVLMLFASTVARGY